MPGLRASLSRLTGLRQRLRTLGHANLRQGAPTGFVYALDNDNSIAIDDDGARGMEAA